MKFDLLTKIGTSISKVGGRTVLTIQKKSPEILLGIGIATFAGTIVAACKATLKADAILEHHSRKMKDIRDAKEIAETDESVDYDEDLYRRDIMIQYTKTGVDLLKVYGPAIALGALSLTCILTSRNILNNRYLSAVAAYNAVSSAFEEYRKRVRTEYGDGLDRHFRYGTTYEEITVETEDENGKKKKEKVTVENSDMTMPNDTSVFFDKGNPNWDENPTFSMMFLRTVQRQMNDLLHVRGHVFLNEVYQALGFPHTPTGAIVGWVDGLGDNCIDFGLYDSSKDTVRRFVNGYDNVILLEFNHDGIIWDKIGL